MFIKKQFVHQYLYTNRPTDATLINNVVEWVGSIGGEWSKKIWINCVKEDNELKGFNV